MRITLGKIKSQEELLKMFYSLSDHLRLDDKEDYQITYTQNSNPDNILTAIIRAEDTDIALTQLYEKYNYQINWRTITKI